MRKQEYRAAQRRKETQHELTMMQIGATQNTAVNTKPTVFQCSNYPMVPGPNSENVHYIGACTYTNRHDDNDYICILNCELTKTASKNDTFGRQCYLICSLKVV